MNHSPFTEKSPLLAALGGEVLPTPPVWFMRQAGRYLPEYREIRQKAGSFLKLCLTPELAAQVTLQPLHRFQMDGAILFSDILVIPWALGQELEFREGEGPFLSPPLSAELLGRLCLKKAPEKWSPIMETVRRVRQDLPPGVALIGFAGAPWTVATYMIEGRGGSLFERSLELATHRSPLLKDLIGLLTDATLLYLSQQVEAGAQVLQIFDTWAGALPPADRDMWVYQPTRALVEGLRKKYPGLPIIGFPRGIGSSYKEFLEKTGVTALSLDSSVDLLWARQNLACPLQGNLDPEILKRGGPSLDSSVRDIGKSLLGHPHIFNLGHGILPPTPIDHVAQALKIIREKELS